MSPTFLSLCLAALLLGAVPTGVLLGRLVGRDPRTGGSGNIGATNVTRTLGRKFGAITLVVDLLKGLVPVLWLAPTFCPDPEVTTHWAAAFGFLAVLGHCYSPFLRFKGGKGVATAFGAMLGLAWPIAALSAVVWAGVVIVTRVVALGSLAAVALFVLLAFFDDRPLAIQAFALCTATLVTVRHVSNLRALRRRPAAIVTPRSARQPKRRRGRG
jgi:glycerol-3-phosphate acyltransferase PlsY